MRKFLFVPILFLMLNIAAAENLEIYEVNMVKNIMIDVRSFLDTQVEAGINNDPNHHQGIVDHITDNILIAKYKIGLNNIGVFLTAHHQTMKATSLYIFLDLVFDEYTYKFPLTPKEGEINEQE